MPITNVFSFFDETKSVAKGGWEFLRVSYLVVLCFIRTSPIIIIGKIILSRLEELPIVLKLYMRMMGLIGFLSTRLVSILQLWAMTKKTE